MSGGLFVKLDPRFLLHRKAIAAGPFGRLLFISGLGYCVESLTDGFIPSRAVTRLGDVDDPDPEASAVALVASGLWVVDNSGYRVANYHEWQSSSGSVQQRRDQAKERQQRYRERKATRDAVASHDALVTRPEPEPEPEPLTTTELSASDDIVAVFDAWKESVEKPGSVLDAKRRRLIREKLKGYDVSDLVDAVRGWKHVPHNRGENERNTVYNDLELLLRDAKHIEQFRDAERAGSQPVRRKEPAWMTARAQHE